MRNITPQFHVKWEKVYILLKIKHHEEGPWGEALQNKCI